MVKENQPKSTVQKAKENKVTKRIEVGSKDTLSGRKRDMMRRISRRDTWARRRKDKDRPKEELDVRLVSIRRVSKVKKGGKTLRMSVMAVIGDKEGNVGVAVAKGKDVRDAQNKAINKAKKNLIKVPLKGQTIPHEVTSKFKAAKVFLRPASPGTGVIAGGAVRAVVEVAGIKDILSKRLGSNNTITNVYATFEALKSLRLKRL